MIKPTIVAKTHLASSQPSPRPRGCGFEPRRPARNAKHTAWRSWPARPVVVTNAVRRSRRGARAPTSLSRRSSNPVTWSSMSRTPITWLATRRRAGRPRRCRSAGPAFPCPRRHRSFAEARAHCRRRHAPGLNQSLRTNGDAAWFGWPTDDKLEALRSQWMMATDSEARQEIAATIEERAFGVVPCIPTGQWKTRIAYRKSLKSLVLGPVICQWGVEKV